MPYRLVHLGASPILPGLSGHAHSLTWRLICFLMHVPAPLALQYMLAEFGQDQGEEKMRSAIGRFGITGPQQVGAARARRQAEPPARRVLPTPPARRARCRAPPSHLELRPHLTPADAAHEEVV